MSCYLRQWRYSVRNTNIAKNIPNLKLINPEGVNVYDLINHQHVLISESSIKLIEKESN